MQWQWIHFSFWRKNILTLLWWGWSASKKTEVGAARNSSQPIKTCTFLVIKSRGQGWDAAASLVTARIALFHFFPAHISHSSVYSPPSTSPHRYVIFFFKVHFETIGTSRSPSDSITSTEIKYIVVGVSAQLSHVETQYKMTTKSSLIGWQIVKAINWLKNSQSLSWNPGKEFARTKGKTVPWQWENV